MKKNKIIPCIMATAIAASSFGSVGFAEQNEIVQVNKGLNIAVLSDTHIFPEKFVGNEGPNYTSYVNGDRKMLKESEKILKSSINRILNSDAEIVLVPGDLTKDSEVEAHEILAKELKRLEDAGKKVFVINGNHDINAPHAQKFEAVSGDANDPNREDKVIELDGIKRDQFEELYKDFGFNEEVTIANDPNSTSYVANIAPGYRLIVMDTGMYGENKEDQSTSGTLYKDNRLDWILNQTEEAKEAGDTVIGMSHHGMIEHFDGQGTVFAPYLVEDYENVSTKLADAGMEYVFTGHFHAQDIAQKTTDAGNTITDIMTGSSVSYPSPIRFLNIDKDTSKIHIESERIESIDGVEDFKKYSEEAMRAGVPGMVSSLLSGILVDLVDGIFPTPEIEQLSEDLEDGIVEYIKENRELFEEELKEAENEEIKPEKDSRATIKINIEGFGEISFDNEKLKTYIKNVCKSLETVEIQTSIGSNYKLMDAIEHCLMEVYRGDEVYSEDMQTLKSELESSNTVRDALVEVLVDEENVESLGEIKFKAEGGLFGIPVQKLLLNAKTLNSILGDAETTPNSLSATIGGMFAGLLDGILSDNTPDNNIAFIGEKVVDFELSKLIINAKSFIDGNYTENSLRKLNETIKKAETIIVDEQATEEQITEIKSDINKTVNELVENGDETNPNPNPNPSPGTGNGSDSNTGQVSVSKLIGENRYSTAVEISKNGWTKSDAVIIVNGDDNSLVDGLTATPLASAKGAPILLTENNRLPQETTDELKRLNPSNIIVIGGESVVSENVIKDIKNIKKDIKVERVGGIDRYDTSLKIAKELDKTNDITKIYIGAGDGEADALSISPVAGREKSPILLTPKNGLKEESLNYIKKENISDAYFIGGDSKISNEAINQVDAVISKDVSKNRVSGRGRQETNAKVIEKFYTSSSLSGVAVAKSDKLIDALSVGPLAAKKDIPVVIATDSLDSSQENILSQKKTSKLFEIGGGIKSTVIEKIKNLVK